MSRRAKTALVSVGCLLLLGLYVGFPVNEVDPGEISDVVIVFKSPPSGRGVVNVYNIAHGISEAEPHSRTRLPELVPEKRPVPELKETSHIYDEYVIYENKCRIRNYGFSDRAVLEKYFGDEPPSCSKDTKPFLFQPTMNLTAGRSCVGIDYAVVKEWYGGNIDTWECTYKEAVRDLKEEIVDLSYSFGEKKTLHVGDCPLEEFIWIECEGPKTDPANAKGIMRFLPFRWSSPTSYQQPLMLPSVKAVRAPIRPNNVGKKPLHVLVVGLDSVSRLNAYRQFPKTLKFLKSKENLIELFGYNKIGSNSNPNQIPLLTGIRYSFEGLDIRLGKEYFDNATRYIWEDYEERGYRTMFYEEKYDWGLFVFLSRKGFLKVPTTYWPRPIIQAIEESTLKKSGNGLCIGPDFPAKHYLDYTYNTMRILGNDRPLFAYSWFVESAHDYLNGGHRIDRDFHDFFENMEDGGILNNTAVFFISDHGFRFGEFRKTALGRYEDMLPYGFVLMPDWYYKENPEALENMKVNSRRLVTVFDLYATLLELANPWSEGRTIRTANGYSLLSNKIPSGRSCKDASINFMFCSCFEPQTYDKQSDLAKSLAEFLIDEINDKIRKNDATGECEEWSVDSIEDFVRLTEGSAWTDYYKATVNTKPAAQFEIAAQPVGSKQGWRLLADIDRTSWFSTHAKCAKDTSYERFCYCK